ncbi:MAG: hypothetical protein FJW90_06510 [Actinobacteria bacterium]|nr:hypothetical protein [Actinomycetota bacterium]
MRSTATRAVLLAVLAAAAIVLFIALSDDGGDDSDLGAETTATSAATTTPEPRIDVIRLENGAPVGGVQELEYEKGDQVRILIRLDEPQEEVHLHGYDITEANPSGTARLDFRADLDGIFELEAHGPSGDVELAELVVNPS